MAKRIDLMSIIRGNDDIKKVTKDLCDFSKVNVVDYSDKKLLREINAAFSSMNNKVRYTSIENPKTLTFTAYVKFIIYLNEAVRRKLPIDIGCANDEDVHEYISHILPDTDRSKITLLLIDKKFRKNKILQKNTSFNSLCDRNEVKNSISDRRYWKQFKKIMKGKN